MKGNDDIERLIKYFSTFSFKNSSATKEKAKPVKEIPIISKGISGSKKSEERKLDSLLMNLRHLRQQNIYGKAVNL